MLASDVQDLALIEEAVRRAGEIARRYYGQDYRRWSKSRGEPVTEADLAIDADRSFVGGKRGKKRDAAVRVDGTGDGGDECLRVAVAAKFRVGADGAQRADQHHQRILNKTRGIKS